MSRPLFAALTIFGLMSIWILTAVHQSPDIQTAGDSLYLPLIISENGIKVNLITIDNCPYNYCLYNVALGTIENFNNQPYTVTLEADVTVYPYTDPFNTPQPPGPGTIQFMPALEAVLPGQLNPFRLEVLCYKSCTIINGVHLKSAQPLAAGSYEPLTILGWNYADSILTGTARNDSGRTLYRARVAVAGQGRCVARVAAVDDATLANGQKTEFSVAYPSGCIDERLILVGQGSTTQE